MLVRCITLSLDRFENQSDAKGEREAMGWDWGVFTGDNGSFKSGLGLWELEMLPGRFEHRFLLPWCLDQRV